MNTGESPLRFVSHTEINESRYTNLYEKSLEALEYLSSAKCQGAEFTGWFHRPDAPALVEDLQSIRALVSELVTYEAVVVIGIGGSYLGTLALSEALADQKRPKHTELIFMGFTLCADYMAMQLEKLKGKNYAVVVVSKSGTTTEPAIAFRYILAAMRESKIGYSPKRIIAVTDASKGTLYELAVKEGFRRLVIPDSIGGRYSILTPVGLLPLGIAGVDLEQLVTGFSDAYKKITNEVERDVLSYATWRNYWLEKRKKVEVLAMYSPFMRNVGEWYKQLYGESEGKNGGGVFPVSVCNTTDLHSLGQYFQEGTPFFFETHLIFDRVRENIQIPKLEGMEDGLQYLEGKNLHQVNLAAASATIRAHKTNAPMAALHLAERDAYHLGYLFYFFEVSCAVGVLMQGNNPFDQPGVEQYKREMFHILGKPGF